MARRNTRALAGLVLAGLAVALLLAAPTGPSRAAAPGGAAGTDPGPARRIVTLAPSLAELTYAAGAGDRLVGVVEYSDHPDEARRLPRVGDAFRLDFEAIAALHPDLILGWPSGNSPAALERLRRLGFRVVELEPRTLADVGGQVLLIGELAGTKPAAEVSAAAYAAGLARTEARYRNARPLRVFFQVAPEPLITVTDRHFIGQAIRLCGGINVFGTVPGLAPTIDREAVVAAAPEVLVANDYAAGGGARPRAGPLDAWRPWRGIPAVATGQLYVLDPDLMGVPGPRMLAGIGQLCADLDQARGIADGH